MNNIITFSARGTRFSLPKLLLKKYPDTLLNNMCTYDSIPVDKFDGDIFIDINPLNIQTIIDIYHYGNLDDINIRSVLQYMDLKYIGFDVKYDKISEYMQEPLNYSGMEDNKVKYDYRYTNIHTADNNIIVVNSCIYDGWIDCKFKSIVVGHIEDYLINKYDDHIDIWIGLNTFKTHYMLSILRDGLNYYYYDYPLQYNDKINDIPCDFKNIEDNEKINFFDKGDYYESGIRGDYGVIGASGCFFGKRIVDMNYKYHILDCEHVYNNIDNIKRTIKAIDINFKLNHKEVANIINNTKKICKSISAIKNAVSYNQYILNISKQDFNEYFISNKQLYFYGILNDELKKQLDNRFLN